jgi:hypothetical protein
MGERRGFGYHVGGQHICVQHGAYFNIYACVRVMSSVFHFCVEHPSVTVPFRRRVPPLLLGWMQMGTLRQA